jgi:hypothetical protein
MEARIRGIFLSRAILSLIQVQVLLGSYFSRFPCSYSQSPDKEKQLLRRVNYAALDVEELGSVYESLLDFAPKIETQSYQFKLVTGSDRKSTGSYYTPPELVAQLIKTALEPVIEERLKEAEEQYKQYRDTNSQRMNSLSDSERTNSSLERTSAISQEINFLAGDNLQSSDAMRSHFKNKHY